MTDIARPVAPHVVVIGGGIAGLSAAWALMHPKMARERSARDMEPTVTVLEAGETFGGKIQTTDFAGSPVDLGADAFLARAPWATHLCQELGLGEDLVSPATQSSWIWTRGGLHPFPRDTVLGVPAHLKSVAQAHIVSPAGLARAAADVSLPSFVGRSGDDPSIADLVGKRLGREVLDRLVDPLLGSINAGPVDHLSLASTAPLLADIASRNHSLILGAREHLDQRDPHEVARPVFNATAGGMGRLIDALVAALTDRGVALHASTRAEGLRRTEAGWQVDLDDRNLHADAVLIATPAPVAAKLLQDVAPGAATLLGGISYASVNMIRLAYRKADVGIPLEGSGFVVPSVDGRLLTACSWASSKWEALGKGDQVILRASAGRRNDERADQLSDDELVAAAHAELAGIMQLGAPATTADVTRWQGAFPQYEPGHAARVLRIEQTLGAQPRLAIAGAAYHGLGIPSCVRNATETAETLLTKLAASHAP